MNRALLLVTLLSLLSLTACKKDETSEPAAAKPNAPEPVAEPAKKADSGPFAGWDMDARKAAFTGAHVTPGNSLGTWEAWNIDGDKVTIWDGKEERVHELQIVSPCWVKTTFKHADGASEGSTGKYTLRNGQLVMGLGDAGAKKGNEAIACVFDRMVRLGADGTCTELERDMFDDTKLEEKPGSCKLVTEGDKEYFAVTLDGRESKLLVDGDAILSEQLAMTHSEKVADFAAAKAARDAKK